MFFFSEFHILTDDTCENYNKTISNEKKFEYCNESAWDSDKSKEMSDKKNDGSDEQSSKSEQQSEESDEHSGSTDGITNADVKNTKHLDTSTKTNTTEYNTMQLQYSVSDRIVEPNEAIDKSVKTSNTTDRNLEESCKNVTQTTECIKIASNDFDVHHRADNKTKILHKNLTAKATKEKLTKNSNEKGLVTKTRAANAGKSINL